MIEHHPQEKIYLTYKTRMTTEARLRKSAQTSHLLLSWYSACLIVLSIINISGRFLVLYPDLISVAVSLVIFALSLFTYGERYNERADQFKNCYLKLKSLYEQELVIEQKMLRYSEVLEQYENQSDKDYDEMLFDSYLRNQKLKNACGPVRITPVIFCRILARRFFKKSLVLTFFVAPVATAVIWVKPLVGG